MNKARLIASATQKNAPEALRSRRRVLAAQERHEEDALRDGVEGERDGERELDDPHDFVGLSTANSRAQASRSDIESSYPRNSRMVARPSRRKTLGDDPASP